MIYHSASKWLVVQVLRVVRELRVFFCYLLKVKYPVRIYPGSLIWSFFDLTWLPEQSCDADAGSEGKNDQGEEYYPEIGIHMLEQGSF